MHAPQTPDGIATWAVLERCCSQVRAGLGGVYALDFTAILLMANAMGAPTALLSDLLPEVEPVIVAAYHDGGDDAGS